MRRTLVWFRRDLRDFDHTALSEAVRTSDCVHCAFIFDRAILDGLTDKADRRVEFIWQSVHELDRALRARGSGLIVRYADAREAIPQLARELDVCAVFCNRDYEPFAVARDQAVAEALARDDIEMQTFKDHVIFDRDEILTQTGTPYSVFTPYKNAWLRTLTPADLDPKKIPPKSAKFAPQVVSSIPTIAEMGFAATNLAQLKIRPGMSGGAALFEDFETRMDAYDEARNFPAVKGPSYLSVHVRFGTVSIRHLARTAHARWIAQGSRGAGTWLSELIWRDFYFHIVHHHPRVVAQAFRAEYDAIAWRNDPVHFARWCAGDTGYPIVDAAMRQLNQTGYMHNRLRMIVAAFLTKDLHIDWRMGERYFAEKLIDYDLAANNGGWQWAASTGCDAQPYFRIFNPVSQSEKFDANGQFIRRYVPELAQLSDDAIHAPWLASADVLARASVALGKSYPLPIVDHAAAREEALRMFADARQRNRQ